MAKVTDMRNNKKVDEKKEEVVVHDEFDYEKLSQIFFDRLREFHEKYDNEMNSRYVNDFTSNDDDYIRFLESKVTRLEYEIAKLKGEK